MTIADIGWDAVFGIEGGTPGTYVAVAEVTAITPPGMTRDAVEVTHLKSSNRYKEFIPGLKDGGEASITLNYDPSATDALVTAFEAEAGNYQITFPDGIRMQFAGFFTAYTIGELTPNGQMTASATMKVTGKATFAAAA